VTPADMESVIYISSDEVREHLTRVAAEMGLTLDEFIEKGWADELEGEARDQWLMWGPTDASEVSKNG
jgi:KaiC/GvpD/RAD55 family RecA-like ATPase